MYQALSNYAKIAVGSQLSHGLDFDLKVFLKTYNLPGPETYAALRKLQSSGLIQLSDSFYEMSQLLVKVAKGDLYKYQVAHAETDALIKTLLRLYGGELFSNFVKIKEGELAKLLNFKRNKVEDLLLSLDQSDVVEYRKVSDKEQLHFLTPRYDVNELPFEAEEIKERNDVILSKAQATIDYVQEKGKCRTRMFQLYFDEISEDDCGICDYCLDRKKKDQFKVVRHIEEYFQNIENASMDRLALDFQQYPRDSVVKAVQELIARGVLQTDYEFRISKV